MNLLCGMCGHVHESLEEWNNCYVAHGRVHRYSAVPRMAHYSDKELRGMEIPKMHADNAGVNLGNLVSPASRKILGS